ncbi:MAG: DNA mismatch repair protein MutS [Acidobacteria bacterium]|nr:MAG: DNA mismatch repair protein MutS [Acidobacteriota bacterium]
MSSENDDPFPENDAPVIIPIEDSLDLHTFSPKELKAVVEEYLFQCHQKGFKEVRIIHGRGKGVQRQMVRTILEKNPLVLRFENALPEAGGWGATRVKLRS